VTQLKDLAELIRLPAALTVPGDALAGAAAAGTLRGWRPAALAASSACMYWAGMALNDYADRDLDQHERPERPIPSGRVSPRTALRVAGGLTGAGVALAACTGRSAACVALPLAASVWTYDLVAKPSLAGPAVMGTARALDVLLGGSAAPRRALPAALLMGVHTVGVTGLSRGEVHGSSPRAAAAAFGTTAAVAAVTAVSAAHVAGRETGQGVRAAGSETGQGVRAAGRGTLARVAGVALAGSYGVAVGRQQLEATANPGADAVRSATKRGIHGMVPLQAALLARAGRVGTAAALTAVTPILRAAAKVVSPT